MSKPKPFFHTVMYYYSFCLPSFKHAATKTNLLHSLISFHRKEVLEILTLPNKDINKENFA